MVKKLTDKEKEERKEKKRKILEKKFIENAIIKHGNKYDYSKVIYTTVKNKVIINCQEHGDFHQAPTNHLYYGCKKCGVSKRSNKQKMTLETFIKESRKLHDNKYNYSKVIYINAKTQVKIICPLHGIFKQRTHDHCRRGNGCKKCSNIENGKKKRLTLDAFINKAISKHDNKYNYSKVIYVKNDVKIKIICPKHGIFEIQPHDHLQGQGCKECNMKNYWNTISFIKQSKIIHGDKYDYSKVVYKTIKEKVTIICPEHGEFFKTPKHHYRGQGCPKCSKNGTSKIAQEWIDLLLVKQPELEHFYHETGEYIIPNTNYKADGYNNKTKTIYEFHGDFWHGNPEIFNRDLINDVCKKTFGQLYEKTMKKQRECEELGYKYNSIWENEWIKGKQALKRIQRNFRHKQMLKKFPYQCEKCNYKCKYKSEYERHCNSVLHKTGKRGVKKNKVNMVCQFCKLYEASCNTNLKNHILINHKTAEEREKEYPNYCKTCDYGSFSKKLFDKHLITKKHIKKENMTKILKDID
jgi:hypothetical protein